MSRRARDSFISPIQDPVDLCRSLNLNPKISQIDQMLRMSESNGIIDEPLGDPETEESSWRAAAMVVLWRTIIVGGNRATILVPSESDSRVSGRLGHYIMSFLVSICKTRNEGLAGATVIPAWNKLQFGGNPDWEVRLVPNISEAAENAAKRSQTGLIVDVGCRQVAMGEAVEAFEGSFDAENGLLIRLW